MTETWFINIIIEMPIFQEKVYVGLEFQVKDDKVCYTPLKDKCEAIQNLYAPKTLKKQEHFVVWLTSSLHSYQT